MNCYTSFFRKFLIVIVLVGFVPSAKAQVNIDTRVGNGADAEIANDDPVFGAAYADDTLGTLGSMNTRFDDQGFAVIRHRASFMRFDISGVSGDLSGAGLTVHNVGQSRTIEVYGMIDSNTPGVEDWDESTISYNTAPGITNQGSATLTGVVDPLQYSFIGTWQIPGPESNGYDPSYVTTTFPAPALPDPETIYTDPANIEVDFGTNLSNLVAADTNGLLSLLFFPLDSTDGNVALRTKEYETNPAFVIAPTLNLPNATMGGVENADFNSNGYRDGADFLIWQRGFGGVGGLGNGDANASGTVDGADFAIWESQFGTPSGDTVLVAQADTNIEESGPDDMEGGLDRMQVRSRDVAGSGRQNISYVRFDLGGETAITDSILSLVTDNAIAWESGQVQVYGLNDVVGNTPQDWVEGTLSYNTSGDEVPGDADATTQDLGTIGTSGTENLWLLGDLPALNPNLGGEYVDFSSTEMVDFLNSRAGGLATLLIVNSDGLDRDLSFRTKESAGFAPTLTLNSSGGALASSHALAAVPEPSTAMLLTIAMACGLTRRRSSTR